MVSTTDIINMTFRRVEGRDLAALDIQMFNIIAAMDGKRSISTIARDNFYEVEFLTEKVGQLLQMGVLEPVCGGGGQSIVRPEKMDCLQAELAKLIGPVAGKLIKDTAAKMGHDTNSFPSEEISDLLEHISKFLKNRDVAADFKRSMMSQLT